jgi:hypothetical protein
MSLVKTLAHKIHGTRKSNCISSITQFVNDNNISELFADYECYVGEVDIVNEESLQAELEINRAEAVRPKTTTKLKHKITACFANL